jgi:hypothetical protein
MEHNWISNQAPLSFGSGTDFPASSSLNPISCIVCRRRKVKCNRVLPSCSNCSKGETRCIYPTSARASRRKQINLQHLGEAENEATLLKRLKHLEGMVTKLSSLIETPSGSGLEDLTLEPMLEAPDDISKEISQELGKLVIEEGGHSRYISSQVWDNLIDEVSCSIE